ncbi:DUF3244 domain-containing protein [Dysgonomonas sp. 521]|uniref:DUF3244 domain-containing protein n=1 Tax=Dysgonomonas sp. 521 TaxID=2302932 RepID=UPI0013D4201A|nr:DUF3244 domain-containing protein [Dysgonomonas sp. 521]NDV94793.1 DUF3244 domain-containing protein [Dysgonomonas sp. 521]
MKKYLCLFTFLLLLAPISISADSNNVLDNKIEIMGEISSEGETKSTGIEPIDIYIEGRSLDFYFYSKDQFKIEIYNSSNVLLYTKTVSRYGGKVLSVNMATWNSGTYRIVITNVTHGKSGTASFRL